MRPSPRPKINAEIVSALRAKMNLLPLAPGSEDGVWCRLRAPATQRRRFGYRPLHILLGREGIVMNHKKPRPQTSTGQQAKQDQHVSDAVVSIRLVQNRSVRRYDVCALPHVFPNTRNQFLSHSFSISCFP
jgi:transposase InsO family protein